MLIVPDASVILKWVLQREDEPDSEQALGVLRSFLAEQIEIRLPTLWRCEVGNILGIKQSRRASEAMDTLLAYEFPEEALHRDYCLAVLDFMKEVKGASFYDASYHVLAVRSEGVYLTADQEYAGRARRMGHIALLSGWRAPGTAA